MDLLRLALLVAGVALIAGIYFWETHKRRRAAEQDAWREPGPDAVDGSRSAYRSVGEEALGEEPAFADADWLDLSISSTAREEQSSGSGAEIESLRGLNATRDGPQSGSARTTEGGRSEVDGRESEELIVVVTVLAHPGRYFAGTAIHAELAESGLRPGAMQIYHRPASPGGGDRDALFSVANVVNPGTLDPRDAPELRSPGLALILRLPGPADPHAAFEAMIEAGHRLAAVLDGVLCDATRSTLSTQAVNHLRERIAEYGRRRLLHD